MPDMYFTSASIGLPSWSMACEMWKVDKTDAAVMNIVERASKFPGQTLQGHKMNKIIKTVNSDQ